MLTYGIGSCHLFCTPEFGYSDYVRVWTSPDKTEEIISGEEFIFTDLPSEIYVEGIGRGTDSVSLNVRGPSASLYSNMVTPSITWFQTDTEAADRVNVTAGLGLTAYRPMHGPNTYDPFRKSAVTEADEEKPDLGPGIRLNWDSDNGNSIVQDRTMIATTPIPAENDLIEVRIDQLPGMNNLILEVDWRMRLFTSPEGGSPLALTEMEPFGNLRSAPLSFTDGTLTVFAEWHADPGEGDVKLINADTNTVLDTLKFHSFESIVIGFSGETASLFGLNELTNYLQHHTYDIAVDFYNRGYDVHYYDVWKHSGTSNFSGPALFEAINAVSNRNVENVAIYGWSHGGGATALLANRLELGKGQGIVPNTFEIAATAYIDAVRYDGPQTLNPVPESRRPLQTLGIMKPHANWYQTNEWPQGASVGGSDIDKDMSNELPDPAFPDHVEIAFEVWRQSLLLNFFEEKMPTR